MKSLKKGTSWWAESYGMRIQLKFKEGYWLSLNPILDLQVGKASGNDASYTYVNTRAINFRRSWR
jgi:hypothetical protein